MKFRSAVILALSTLYFVFAGFLLIPYAGFQHDEVVFAQPIYQRGLAFYSRHLGHRWIPMMINSYAGALKTWVYWPILKVWHPSPYSLRVPSMLIAALAMVMFWPIMVRAGGKRAAAIVTVLLATDSMYLMTSVFDWGPCALQHFFLVAVMLAFIRYHETGNPRILALASFLAGAALWEKALFFWLAGGLAVACAAIYPKYILKRVSLRNLSIAAASFVVGAMPFIMYNVHKPNSTLGENAAFSTEQFSDKVEAAHRTFDAHAIFNYIAYDDWVQPAREARTDIEETSLELREATGITQRNYMLWAYALSVLLIPFAWRTRAWPPMLFALIFCAVGWGLMLITKNAGASVHHVILLWPITLMFLALPLSEASRRLPGKIGIPVLCVVVGIFAAKNILVTNEYLAQFIRNGPTVLWTNALYPLSADLEQSHYGEIDGIDWGTNVPLQVLERATVPLGFVSVDEKSPQDALSKMDKPDIVFLGHIRGLEVYPGVDDKIDAIASKNGMTKQVIKTYPDGNGRPIFELFQYHPAVAKAGH
jgi:hypothetical protein